MNLSLLFSVLFGIAGILLAIPATIVAIQQIRDQRKNRQGNQAQQPVPTSGSNRFRFSRLRNLRVVPLLLPLLAILLTSSGVFNIIQQNQIATLTNQIAILNQRFSHVLTPTNTSSPSPTVSTSTLTSTAKPTASIVPAASPTLNDPLQDNSKGFQWDEGSLPGGQTCGFVTGKYYLLTAPANKGVGCNTEARPQSVFSNFVYQITMTILSGLDNTNSGAGPQFRKNPDQNASHYKVTFDVMGNWHLWLVVNDNASILPDSLVGARCGNPCSYFHTGLNQPNVFTIWDVGNKIDVFVNGHLIDTCSDSTYTSGFLGVRADPGTSSASVAFNNLSVWRL